MPQKHSEMYVVREFTEIASKDGMMQEGCTEIVQNPGWYKNYPNREIVRFLFFLAVLGTIVIPLKKSLIFIKP